MTDQVLNILKFVLLGLLYLFFARCPVGGVERGAGTRAPPAGRPPQVIQPQDAGGRGPRRRGDHADREIDRRCGVLEAAKRKAAKAATKVVAVAPPDWSCWNRRRAAGLTFPIAGEITLGRDPASTIVVDDDAFVSQTHLRVVRLRRPTDGRGPRLDERHLPQRRATDRCEAAPSG